MTLLKKQLGFALPVAILIVVVLIAAGGVGYYFYKTSQEQEEQVVYETADWKVYQNERYGFEIKYPKDWKIVNVDWAAGREYVQFLSPLINNKYYFVLNFGARNKGDNTQISYQSDENWELLKSFMRLGDKVKIGNVDALTTEIVEKGKIHSILYSNKLGAGRIEIFGLEIQANSGFIEGPQHLSVSDVESIDLKNLPELKLANQILSTFKFIEKISKELLIIPVDWNTYTNPEANFTFRYPQNWEIREEYFYKGAENPTVVVCRQEEPIGIIANCIQINMPQFPCETVREIKGNWIGICVEDPEISEVYYQVINSFRCIEDETADWKVYRNEKYGYSFKYPQDWKTKERNLMSDLGHRDFVWIQSDEYSIGPYTRRDELNIDIWDFSFFSYDQLTEPPPGGIDPDTIKKKEIILDQKPATELSYIIVGDAGSGSREGKRIFVQKEQMVWIIDCDSEKCDKIISTFKFIEK